ncbi:hypothetical protein AVEN_178333-1 [Araneus ventricosus]|uniref:Uncharacterized protein n=1 Tax=Araneus ventricosus TaxID=182803 RepID=A0A4Y2BC70_ARAVE|nr:hypothetical protein AVEN_178333-1 [Araneus ventricosus]
MHGENAISDSKLRKRTRFFKKDRLKVYAKSRSGQPSVITNDLVQAVDIQNPASRRFIISKHFCEFPLIPRSVLFKIVSEDLQDKKLCCRWVPKLLNEGHKKKRLAILTLTVLSPYNEEGKTFKLFRHRGCNIHG